VLEGNPGRRPLPKNEPQPATGVPSRPELLSPEAKREWSRIVDGLPPDLLTKVDRAMLAAFCQAWADWCEAVEDLRVNGWYYTTEKGYEGQRPAAAKMVKAREALVTLSGKIGLSPADRTRLSMPEKPEKTLEELLG
jgi:P27 family predicted phage terminase small subunit